MLYFLHMEDKDKTINLHEFLLRFTRDIWLPKVSGANFSYYDALEEFLLERPEEAKFFLNMCLEMYRDTGTALLPLDFIERVLQKLENRS